MHLSRVFHLDLPSFSKMESVRPGAACGLLVCFAAAALAQSPASAPAPGVSALAASAPAPSPAVTSASRPVAAAALPASRSAPARSAKSNGRQATKPLWRELKSADQVALAPLAGSWDAISVAQKRKWLALSKNFPKMTPDDQAKLHSRMTAWVALSPQQRAEARLNFGKTQLLSPNDKKAKWEAYQALPPEEKKKLAAVAAKPPATAPAVKPVPTDKLATIHRPRLGTKPAGAASAAASAPAKPASAAVPASAPASSGAGGPASATAR